MRGQISFDLLLALVALILFLSVLSIYNTELVQTADRAAIKNGLRTVLSEVYTAVGTAKTYSEITGARDYVIGYNVLRFKQGERPWTVDCTIRITNNSISVSDSGESESYENIDLTGLNARFGAATWTTATPFTIPCADRRELWWS